MALEVHRRRRAAEQRRQERLALAETPTAELNAAFDYLRASMRAVDAATRPGEVSRADRIRSEVAKQLVKIADEAREQKQGRTT